MVEKAHLIDLKSISKDFGSTTVLDNINLYVRKKEFVTLLGPSGCGKTTTLRIIGGFEYPSSGQVYFDGKDITHIPPYKRKVNTVFQKYALFPHLNVQDNIAFGLKIAKVDRDDIRSRVDAMLDLVNLKGYGKRSVESLSGGQQQRVAIARALVAAPKILFADEPTGNLDSHTAQEIMELLRVSVQRDKTTLLFVTHDMEKAAFADRVIHISDGMVANES